MKRLLFFQLFCLTINGYSHFPDDTTQSKNWNSMYVEKHLALMTGYWGFSNHYAEIGLAINHFGRLGFHPIGSAYYISTEIKIDKNTVVSPKIGGWFTGGVAATLLGISLVYYTDFTKSSLRLRPEVGFGLGFFKMTYGYNISLTNSRFPGANKHLFNLTFIFSLKKLKTSYKEFDSSE